MSRNGFTLNNSMGGRSQSTDCAVHGSLWRGRLCELMAPLPLYQSRCSIFSKAIKIVFMVLIVVLKTGR